MRHEGEVRVSWNRAELTAIREAIEVTPNFIGRLDAREVVRAALKSPRHKPVEFERSLAETLANRSSAALARQRPTTASSASGTATPCSRIGFGDS